MEQTVKVAAISRLTTRSTQPEPTSCHQQVSLPRAFFCGLIVLLKLKVELEVDIHFWLKALE